MWLHSAGLGWGLELGTLAHSMILREHAAEGSCTIIVFTV
jgi:hypothetical protein